MIPDRFEIPTTDHLLRAYHELAAIGGGAVGRRRLWPYYPKSTEELLAVCAELSRHDPRLFEIIATYVKKNWEKINWLVLRHAIQQVPSPQVWGVIGEIVCGGSPDAELRNCFRFLMHGMKAAPTQLFYHLLYTPGSPLADRAVSHRLKEFEKWGYMASERPIMDSVRKHGAGKLSASARRELLHKLARENGKVRMQDYLQALPHSISRQQALADFHATPGFHRRGTGRAAIWHFQKPVA